jgi:hypothetical protein
MVIEMIRTNLTGTKKPLYVALLSVFAALSLSTQKASAEAWQINYQLIGKPKSLKPNIQGFEYSYKVGLKNIATVNAVDVKGQASSIDSDINFPKGNLVTFGNINTNAVSTKNFVFRKMTTSNVAPVIDTNSLKWSITQNFPPKANAGADQNVAINSTVLLNGNNSSDPEGVLLTYQWTLTKKPTGSKAKLSNLKVVEPNFVADKMGSYTISLKVSDGKNTSIVDDVVITVTNTINHNPTITSSAVTTATVGQNYSYDANATDVDGDTLTYALTTKPNGMTIDSNTGLINWVPNSAGNTDVAVTVSDGKGGKAVQNFTIVSQISSGKEWFVSPTGSDQTGDGSLNKPFKTITYLLEPANAIVQASDIVTLRGLNGNNTYNECDVRLRVPLTLRSYTNERAHIHCDVNTLDSVTVQIDPDASNSTLTGLEISGGYYYGIFLQTDWDSRANTTGKGASKILLDNLLVHDTGRDAIKITPKSDDVTIRNSEIHHSGARYPAGTVLDEKNAEGIDNVNGSRMHVHDNYIHDIATTGLYFKGGAADVVVERNRIERTGVGGIMYGFDTSPEFFDTKINPNYYEAIRGIVRNNLVRDTNYAGIGLYAVQDATVANNTIIRTAKLGHAGIYFGVTLQDYEPEAKRPANVNPTIRNNLIMQEGGDCIRVRWANELGGLSALSGTPETDYNWFYNSTGTCNFADNRPGSTLDQGGSLVDWQALEKADSHSQEDVITLTADGHLLSNSPVIDKGQTLVNVTDDIDQQKRTALFDIGFDEFQ